jgi:hypothetical protein
LSQQTCYLEEPAIFMFGPSNFTSPPFAGS